MTIKMIFAAAIVVITCGLAVPATAAEPAVKLAMASFAASTASVDAAALAEAKQEHYRAHHERHAAPHQEGATCSGCSECEDCVTCNGSTECSSCGTASCEGDTCHSGESQDTADA